MKVPATTPKIGLFYGSSTCYTEISAEKIRDQIGADNVDIYNIADEPIATAAKYDYLIFGIPTWDYGELQEDWENIWDDIDCVDFSGKTAALFGQGDQVGYPEWFLDAMGYLWGKLVALGATTVGQWPIAGFEFSQSKALAADNTRFVGLALDDENDFEKSDERIHLWCKQVMREFGLSDE